MEASIPGSCGVSNAVAASVSADPTPPPADGEAALGLAIGVVGRVNAGWRRPRLG